MSNSMPNEESTQADAPDARPPRPPWSAFKAALADVGFHPSRRLGQNFLLDENVVRAIAHAADLRAGEPVLEVGPGCGFLSVHLAHSGAKLLAVEIDPRLADVARSFLEPYSDVTLIECDVLAGKHKLAPEVEAALPADGEWQLVANLPYSISGPLLALMAAREHPPRSMTVLVQLEVADRLVAEAGTRAWGPLSISVQSAYRGARVRTVGPQNFWPRPKVDSAVVRFERLDELPPLALRERRVSLVARLFQRRRQALG
ncbi:MAG: 16S rRNA (adenine1518-N6/adenine1519-N6)-dimethyltransferase, partial [Planctomycetota bacterium]